MSIDENLLLKANKHEIELVRNTIEDKYVSNQYMTKIVDFFKD